ELDAAAAQDVDRRHALGDVERVVAGHKDDGEAEADRLGTLAQGREEDVGARAVADLEIEMLLGDPEMIEAGGLGGDALVETVPEGLALRRLAERAGDLELRHQSELHRRLLCSAIASDSRRSGVLASKA